jgi:caffeoyl-CoA O-methyltransferase
MLSKMIRPRLVLEIATYLGYSALCLAEGLAENGRLITLDVNEETNEVAKSFVERTEFAEAIEFRLGDALELIPAIEETPDLVFIDADKENYSNYYRLVMERLRPGGVIIADNVLWSGKVLENEKDASTLALYEFNKLVLEDARVSNVLLPIRDGLMVVRREA